MAHNPPHTVFERTTTLEVEVEHNTNDIESLQELLDAHITQDITIVEKFNLTLNNVNHSVDILNLSIERLEKSVDGLEKTVGDVSQWKTKVSWIVVGAVGIISTLASIVYYIKNIVG